jgi:polyisoprenoid-binding protein YceI
MKKLIIILLAITVINSVDAQYKPVDNGSSVQFTIKNLGINVKGAFSGLEGTILFDPSHVTDAVFDVSIDANTVNTGNDMRDNHLRNDSYFDVKKYPRIHFVSTKVESLNKKGAWLTWGKLTIKNHTKDISFPFTADGSAGGGYVFKGKFNINRKDFDVGGTSIISDNLEVVLTVLAR